MTYLADAGHQGVIPIRFHIPVLRCHEVRRWSLLGKKSPGKRQRGSKVGICRNKGGATFFFFFFFWQNRDLPFEDGDLLIWSVSMLRSAIRSPRETSSSCVSCGCGWRLVFIVEKGRSSSSKRMGRKKSQLESRK